LFAVTLDPGANVNVSRLSRNESEPAIAVDPSNPSRLFAASVISGAGLLASYSIDGGATWSPRVTGDGLDDLAPACCDPSVAFDAFGNLFLTYLADSNGGIVVASSKDGGRTFSTAAVFRGDLDQPTIVTGPGSVWVTMAGGRGVVAAGAAVTGFGAVGPFSKTRAVPGSAGGSFGDIAVGPAGQVTVAYQRPVAGQHASKLYTSTDPDGLGPAPFSVPVPVSTTNVGGFDEIPAQGTQRSIDAEIGLAYDRSGGPFNGRLYAVYTEEPVDESNDTDVYVRYSDSAGARWSLPVRVNDDATATSQFLPRIALDQTTGNVGIAWLDSRDDSGTPPDSTDTTPNNDATLYAAVVTPVAGGVAVSPNVRVGRGISNADQTTNSIGFGDYNGLDFRAGVLHPAWADNSNATGDNRDGTHGDFDLYSSAVHVVDAGATAASAKPTIATGTPPRARGGRVAVARGAGATVKVTYTDDMAIDPSSVNAGDLTVVGPAGQPLAVELVRYVANAPRTSVTATYRILAPAGAWSAADNGTYTVAVKPGEVYDTTGSAVAPGAPAGTLVVRAKPAPAGPRRKRAPTDPFANWFAPARVIDLV
jgi:hypothetical protein